MPCHQTCRVEGVPHSSIPTTTTVLPGLSYFFSLITIKTPPGFHGLIEVLPHAQYKSVILTAINNQYWYNSTLECHFLLTIARLIRLETPRVTLHDTR